MSVATVTNIRYGHASLLSNPSDPFIDIIKRQKYCKNNSQDVAEERAAKVFHQLDVNDDGELNEEEFVFGALKV